MFPIVDMVESQIIAAVQSEQDLNEALQGKANIIFLLTGSIMNIKDIVGRVQSANKHVFIHMDFMEGVASDKGGIQYIAHEIRPNGILSTRSNLIRIAKDNGLMAIQRIFLIDRNAIGKGIKAIEQCQPDAVEVMPGLMPRVIHEITKLTPLPIIAGGLIQTEEEVMEALQAGALAVSVGSKELWNKEI